MGDFPSLGISMNISKTNTLKTHTGPHTVRGRPTLQDVEPFSEQVGPRTRFIIGSLFVNNIIYRMLFYEYEDRFAKIGKMSSFSEWTVDPHECIA